MSRAMFPKAKFFKQQVAESFILSTREIYKDHPTYTFSDAEEETKIMIEASYSKTHHDGKSPRMVVKIGSYNKDLTDMIANNIAEPIYDSGILVGYERRKIIRVPITVIVHAYSEEESSNLSDELSDLVLVFAKDMYTQKGVVPMGAHVSETDVYDDAQGIYQTTVSITADVPWVYSTTGNKNDLVDDLHFGASNYDKCSIINSLGDHRPYEEPGLRIFKKYLEDTESHLSIAEASSTMRVSNKKGSE